MLLKSWPKCPECGNPMLVEIKDNAKCYCDTEMVCYNKDCSDGEDNRLNNIIKIVKEA